MVYVHVPFCRSFCTYCDFYSELCPRSDSQQVQSRYIADLLEEIKARGGSHLGRCPLRGPLPQVGPSLLCCRGWHNRRDESLPEPETLYIGGGTPSVLAVEMVGQIVEALGPREYEEFTIEVNPDDIVEKGEEYVRRLREIGVNRVSMGVQSFDDGMLRWMNRRHDAAEAKEAFRILRACGVDNISIDLIFGISHLSDGMWERSIQEALELGPEHISAYQLSIEDGSALGMMVREGRYVEAGDEQCRRQYDLLCRRLGEAGYRHYEISNWARPGREAVHNSAYWRRAPYIGLGPGAHSLSQDNIRSWNSQELSGWHSESETLSADEIREEEIMLALRTADGMALARLRELSSPEAVEKLLAEGSLQITDPRGVEPYVRIPEDRFFVSDDIVARLI